jgi:pimeloyl-ACP methyl ester carboxylesterase
MKKRIMSIIIRGAASAAGLALASCAHVATLRDAAGKVIPLELSSIEKVELNGTTQWIYVAGASKDNPVLLWLDGGPVGSEVGAVRRYLGPLHERFTVVCWDQRGTGRSWKAVRDWKTAKVEDWVEDVVALSRLLSRRFGRDRIYIAGESWGSIIGVMAAARAPELYAAYVGIGQQVNSGENDTVSWKMVIDGARAAGEEKLARKIEAMGPPPYAEGGKYQYLFTRLWKYSPHPPGAGAFDSGSFFKAPEHRLIDRLNTFRGLLNGLNWIYPKLSDLDFERDAVSFDCPMFMVNGRYDLTCVATITERWFEKVRAPVKDLRWFEHSGHSACYTEAQEFTGYMVDTVLARTAAAAR